LPSAHSKAPWPEHDDFAVNDKTFANLPAKEQPFGFSCKLPYTGYEALQLPSAKPTAYGLGKSGWVSFSPPEDAIPGSRSSRNGSRKATAPKRRADSSRSSTSKPIPDEKQVRRDRAVNWMSNHWTSRDGLKLFYRDYPGPSEQPPLLCLHGLTRNSRDFEDLADRYAGQWRVIVPDFRGRGMSDWDPQPERYLPTTYAADVLQLLDELGIDRAVFVGTSLGGLVTMLVASIQPQRIAAAVLNDVGPELDQRGLDRISSYVGRPVRFTTWDEAADYIAEVNRGLPATHTHADWLLAARRLCKEDGDGVIFDYDMAIAEPFKKRNDGGATFDMWPLFRQLAQVPLLILRGENSDLLSAEAAQAMAEASPGAELVVVPGVGHAPSLTEPEAIAAIDRLLRRVPPKAAGPA
jgi:pimeloyl-ACP methyl ester carboxylesterase